MSLASHLEAVDIHRELAELSAKTDNLVRILAYTDASNTAMQADLG